MRSPYRSVLIPLALGALVGLSACGADDESTGTDASTTTVDVALADGDEEAVDEEAEDNEAAGIDADGGGADGGGADERGDEEHSASCPFMTASTCQILIGC